MAFSSSSGLFSPEPPLLTQAMKDGECRSWAELPSELTSLILRRLGSIDILENAQKVCTSWRRVCKDTTMWRKIDMCNSGDLVLNLEMMCRHAVDRSQGGLVEIDIWHFGTDSLLNYIADRSSNLRSLRLAMCSPITTDGLTEAIAKLPLLEELEVSYCSLSGESLKLVGQSLPNLKTLKLNLIGLLRPRYESDIDALAIAETMHGLRFLQLFGNILTNGGLNAILDNCPDLEHLDLRFCFNVYNVGDLVTTRCSEKIKVLRLPYDSTDDYPYAGKYYDIDSSDEDSPWPLMAANDYYHSFAGYMKDGRRGEDDHVLGFREVEATIAPPLPVLVAERRKFLQLRRRRLKLPGSEGSVSLTLSASVSRCCLFARVWVMVIVRERFSAIDL
uniref:F-box domain-containing protein n=1 Tax=Brassica oleracea TaxID=3712 RepID=A0A3P6E900_BRAOL|nr:unnamed protein product [Brassica oleracea]